MRLDALIRVSQRAGRGGDSFRSPAQQREVIERWSNTNDARIVAWYESIDVSGKTMARADVTSAIERIKAGQTDGVIIAWLNRLSRAPVREALTVLEEVRSAGGQVVAVDMAGLDPNDATGEMALTTLLAVNRMQWRQVAERWDMNRRDAIRAGIPPSKAPFGYTRGSDRRFVVVPEEAKIVRELFERKASGATWLELSRWMDSASPQRAPWHRNTIKRMLSSHTYMGEAKHGKHSKPNAHEAIVSPALWRKAQNEPGRRTPRGTYLLSGLARCSGCGRTLRGTVLGRNTKRVYTCQTRGCPKKTTIMVERLDAEATKQIFDRLESFHVVAAEDNALEQARSNAATLTNDLELLARVVPKHPSAVAAHQEALNEAEQKLEQAEDLVLSLMQPHCGIPGAQELLRDWARMTLQEQREILQSGLDAVLVRRASRRGPGLDVAGRILVLFSGDAPTGLLDRLSPIASWAWNDDIGSLRISGS